jgi:O-acetyl-ADP-ribose deacetylase (regulator of RNase III)
MADKLIIGQTSVVLVKGDITQETTDAIVNAANPGLMGGGGVDGAIHRAGGPLIKEECQKIISRIGRLETGKAVITRGGNLPARYVIHTAGPVWHNGQQHEAELLVSAYGESLKLATSYKLISIAFPSISTGAYGYPAGAAAGVAINTVAAYLSKENTSLREIHFVLFDQYTYDKYKDALQAIKL